jgi:hypothetical protein
MFNTQLYKDYLRPREKHKLPSGKRLHSYGKSLFLMVNPLSMVIFISYVSLPEGIFF